MGDDARKPDRWGLPDHGLDWEKKVRREAESFDEFFDTHEKETADFVSKIDYSMRWNRFVAFMLARAVLSAQTRIAALESELAAVTGRPPPASGPQDDRLSKLIESAVAGVTRGGIKALMPDLPD